MVKQKLLSIVIALIFVFSFPLHVSALSGSISTSHQSVAENKLSSFGEYTITHSQELYNMHLQLEAICYNFCPYGYVIVNVNDDSVPEFSPSSTSPYDGLFGDSDLLLIYNGPGNYFYYTENDQLISIDTGSVISFDAFDYVYTAESVTLSESLAKKAISRGSTYSITTDYVPSTWSTSYYCVVDGCAIIFKYLDSYHNNNLLASTFDDNEELQAYLVENNYLPNAGVLAWQVPNGFLTYSGANGFFDDRGTNFHSACYTYSDSNLGTITQSIAYNYPLLLEIYQSEIWSYSQHFLIIYGYYTDGNEAYFIANNGAGTNNLYFDANPTYYGDMILFNQ